MCFFEEVSGIAEPDRWTSAAVYLLAKKEILASALPGGVPRQAPRFPTIMLSSPEELVMDASVFYLLSHLWMVDSVAILGNFEVLGPPGHCTSAGDGR